MRTLRIYSLNNLPVYHTTLTIVILLYIISLVLLYLIIGSLYLLTSFLLSPLPSPTLFIQFLTIIIANTYTASPTCQELLQQFSRELTYLILIETLWHGHCHHLNEEWRNWGSNRMSIWFKILEPGFRLGSSRSRIWALNRWVLQPQIFIKPLLCWGAVLSCWRDSRKTEVIHPFMMLAF